MDERDFVNAIVDDPTDDFLPRVFADWLEEHGQSVRAEYVRTSCDLSLIPPGRPEFRLARSRLKEAWRRCRPSWWKPGSLSGIHVSHLRGLIRLAVSSGTEMSRLEELPWLSRAIEEGWLGWLKVSVGLESMAQELLNRDERLRQIPLQIFLFAALSEELLIRLSDIPRLVGLELWDRALLASAIHRLVDRQDLRSLTLRVGDLNFYPPVQVTHEAMTRLLECVGHLVHLRSLKLEGPSAIVTVPANISSLSGMTGLRTLTLSHWPDLTIEALYQLRTLTGLRRLNLAECPHLTDEGLRRAHEALPSLQIHREARP